MIEKSGNLLQRTLKRFVLELLKLSMLQVTLLLVAVAVIVSVTLVMTIDYLWDGRFSTEMEFAGVVVPLLDGVLIVGLLVAFFSELREEEQRNRQAQEEIKFKNTILQTLQETPLDAILVVDDNEQIISCNQQFNELWALSSQMTGETPCAALLRSIAGQVKNSEPFLARIQYLYRHHDKKSREEIELKDGRIIDQYSAPIMGVEGRYYGRVWYCRDITESKKAEEQIRNFAFYDILTQLPNRHLLTNRLNQAMAAGRRNGRYGAVMFLDLDNFKPLNDRYGHDIGDLLLIEVAYRITGCVREMDTVSRFGGDEFVVMLLELDTDKRRSVALANRIAEKIRVALAEPYFLTQRHGRNTTATVEHRCTSSIGVVVFCGHEESQEEVIKEADKAMYQAKEDGRNIVRIVEKNSEDPFTS
jgi:diguanylate cyclase (GGDEF)-like protein/PAS domain S-box-containing protein